MSEHVESLRDRVAAAVSSAIGSAWPELTDADPVVRRSEHADFQSNGALALSRHVAARPAEFAAELAGHLGPGGGTETELLRDVQVSGPGFLNLSVTDHVLWEQVAARLAAPRLGVPRGEAGRRTVIDYSAPNIAKDLHVGHLRSTVIGDSLARVLAHLGADVIRQNHLGDWGTPFGMLIQYLDEHPDATWHRAELADGASAVSAPNQLYRDARAAFDADPEFADRSRTRVVALQSGDDATVAAWRDIVAESERGFGEIYARLGILLTPADSAGESFYNSRLDAVVRDLRDAGLAEDSDGAVVVFSASATGPDGRPIPLILRKRDGGYGYDTTDLATIRYRLEELRAGRILYVVDARQALHFRLVFETARRASWLADTVDVEHVAFGTVLDADGRPFRTRAGDTVGLTALLDAAVERARTVVGEKNPELDTAELDRIAETAGVGAVKYAELSTSRVKDYAFDVDRMVSFSGDTGVYLQYAHTRIRSILRGAGDDGVSVDAAAGMHPAERALAIALDGFGDALTEVAATLEPHRLCTYLYDTARAFTDFYEACPVLTAPPPAHGNRLALCRLTAATLQQGLGLLGIEAPERM
ncbi:arginine--tRNA ligase [Jiangella asiatica]|uniref:arginine--tRNA ligase n=1 Tax=Jiangella asiatica TaxID=2530372 RepID=UPI001EF02D86|nr:arginine--tRNA ligase [Jiangella asiatica]